MSQDKELKVMESAVLKAADECPQWKDGLKRLSPDTFKPKGEELRVGDIVLCGSAGSINGATNNKYGIIVDVPTYAGDVFVEFFEDIGTLKNRWGVCRSRIKFVHRPSLDIRVKEE